MTFLQKFCMIEIIECDSMKGIWAGVSVITVMRSKNGVAIETNTVEQKYSMPLKGSTFNHVLDVDKRLGDGVEFGIRWHKRSSAFTTYFYTRKNAQLVTNLLQTCSKLVGTSLLQDLFALLVPAC